MKRKLSSYQSAYDGKLLDSRVCENCTSEFAVLSCEFCEQVLCLKCDESLHFSVSMRKHQRDVCLKCPHCEIERCVFLCKDCEVVFCKTCLVIAHDTLKNHMVYPIEAKNLLPCSKSQEDPVVVKKEKQMKNTTTNQDDEFLQVKTESVNQFPQSPPPPFVQVEDSNEETNSENSGASNCSDPNTGEVLQTSSAAPVTKSSASNSSNSSTAANLQQTACTLPVRISAASNNRISTNTTDFSPTPTSTPVIASMNNSNSNASSDLQGISNKTSMTDSLGNKSDSIESPGTSSVTLCADTVALNNKNDTSSSKGANMLQTGKINPIVGSLSANDSSSSPPAPRFLQTTHPSTGTISLTSNTNPNTSSDLSQAPNLTLETETSHSSNADVTTDLLQKESLPPNTVSVDSSNSRSIESSGDSIDPAAVPTAMIEPCDVVSISIDDSSKEVNSNAEDIKNNDSNVESCKSNETHKETGEKTDENINSITSNIVDPNHNVDIITSNVDKNTEQPDKPEGGVNIVENVTGNQSKNASTPPTESSDHSNELISGLDKSVGSYTNGTNSFLQLPETSASTSTTASSGTGSYSEVVDLTLDDENARNIGSTPIAIMPSNGIPTSAAMPSMEVSSSQPLGSYNFNSTPSNYSMNGVNNGSIMQNDRTTNWHHPSSIRTTPTSSNSNSFLNPLAMNWEHATFSSRNNNTRQFNQQFSQTSIPTSTKFSTTSSVSSNLESIASSVPLDDIGYEDPLKETLLKRYSFLNTAVLQLHQTIVELRGRIHQASSGQQNLQWAVQLNQEQLQARQKYLASKIERTKSVASILLYEESHKRCFELTNELSHISKQIIVCNTRVEEMIKLSTSLNPVELADRVTRLTSIKSKLLKDKQQLASKRDSMLIGQYRCCLPLRLQVRSQDEVARRLS